MKTQDIKILAIVGMSGSGKSVVVDELTSRGIPKVHFGNKIYQEMAKRGIERDSEGKNEREFREMIRATEGQDWVVRQAIAEANDLIAAGQKRIVLDGVYSWTEYKVLKHEFPGLVTFLAILTPKKLRYERVAKRPDRPFDAAALYARDQTEIENLEKGGPIAASDYFILNDGSLEHLQTQLRAILKTINF